MMPRCFWLLLLLCCLVLVFPVGALEQDAGRVEATNEGWRYALAHKEEKVPTLLERWQIDHAEKARPTLNADERAWLEDHAQLRYCFRPYWPPFDYLEDGEHRGMLADYMRLFEGRLGVELTSVASESWQQAFELVRKGRCDLVAGAFVHPSRETFLTFTRPYIQVPHVLVALSDKPFVSGIADLAGQRIGVMRGGVSKELLSRDYPNLQMLRVAVRDMERALLEGEVYAYVTSLDHALDLIDSRPERYRIIAKLDYAYPLAVGVREDLPLLAGIMDKAVASLTPTDHNDIRGKWMTYTVRERIDYRSLWQVLAITFLIISIVLYWNRKLVRAKEALRRSEGYYRSLIASMGEGVVVLAHTGHILTCNAAAEQILGISKEQLTGRALDPCWRKIHEDGSPFPSETYPAMVALRTGLPQRGVTLGIEKPDGELSWILINAEPMIHCDGAHPCAVVATFTDITARRQAERAIVQAREAAEAANRAKSAFLANMSHELRTPLNGVLGYAEILRRDADLSPSQRQAVSVIRRSGEYLLTLINDVLDLARIEAGQLELMPGPFEPAQFFRELTEIFRRSAEAKGIDLRYETSGTLPSSIECDEKRLRQVCMNLLGNAVKFTEVGDVCLSTDYRNGRLEIRVSDTGIGIPEAMREEIFHPFRQIGAKQYRQQGTGLGLSISRSLIAQMGGEITLDSDVGAGSCFRVGVPAPFVEVVCSPEEQRPVADHVVGYRRLDDKTEPLRFLVVDDNAENRSVLRGLLAPLGFAIEEAADGAAAVALTEGRTFDVILMDLVMPGLDGLRATQRILARPGVVNRVIVAVTARAFAENRSECLAAGCSAHLTKPVNVRELLAVLRAILPIEWRYRTPAKRQPTPPKLDAEPMAAQVRALPEPLRDSLEEALVLGNVSGIAKALEAVRAQDAVLEKGLRRHVAAYEYERVLGLLEANHE